MKRHNMLRADVGQFSKAGLELAACGNTMKSQNVSLKDLLPGFISAEKAAWSASPSCNRKDISTCGPEPAPTAPS